MTIHELRAEHAQEHFDHKCACSLWYVPTPAHVRVNDINRRSDAKAARRTVKA